MERGAGHHRREGDSMIRKNGTYRGPVLDLVILVLAWQALVAFALGLWWLS